MGEYRFSPIQTEEELIDSVRYVAEEVSRLATKIIGIPLTTESLTIFSHSPEEFDKLCEFLEKLGEPYNYNNGPRVKLHELIAAGDSKVEYLRVRKPDAERPQVGCADFNGGEYQDFKQEFYPRAGLREIKRTEYDMIEFFDSNSDVLGYVVSQK